MQLHNFTPDTPHDVALTMHLWCKGASGALGVSGAYHMYRRNETVWKSEVWGYGFINL